MTFYIGLIALMVFCFTLGWVWRGEQDLYRRVTKGGNDRRPW